MALIKEAYGIRTLKMVITVATIAMLTLHEVVKNSASRGRSLQANESQMNQFHPLRSLRVLLDSQESEPHQIGIVHIGKCGGVGLSHSLFAPSRTHEEPMIQQKRPEWYHMRRVDASKYNEWIVLVRDPIERIKSAYIYEHPQNARLRKDGEEMGKDGLPILRKKQLYACFNSLDSLAQIGLSGNAPAFECRDLAREIFEGESNSVNGMSHFNYNFEFYLKDLLAQNRNDTKIWVIRQEHMLDDVNYVDGQMGGAGISSLFHWDHMVVKKDDLPVSSTYVSPIGMENLCRVLCSEIQFYKQLFLRAENFDSADFMNHTKATLARNCPREAYVDECPEKFIV